MAFDDLWLRIQHNGKGISLEEQKIYLSHLTKRIHWNWELTRQCTYLFCHFIITEQHQGQIAVTCSENEGTTFHIQLPTK